MKNYGANPLYVLITPPPNPKSSGITYFNDLAKYLEAIGKRVLQIYHIEPQGELYLWGADTIPNSNHWQQPWQGKWFKWFPGLFQKIFDQENSIVIHGENKHYKWFEDLNVVRYYLAGIGALQKKGVARSGEFNLAWDRSYCETADFILRRSMFRGNAKELLHMNTSDRHIDLTYVGKAWIHNKNTPRIANTIELTRMWPTNDEEYFYLLSKTRRLFSYDSITSVTDDAIFLGALPVFLDESKKRDVSWLSSVNEELEGCFAFLGDDYQTSIKKFETNRIKFIEKMIKRNDEFLNNLSVFCNMAEQKFFPIRYKEIIGTAQCL